MQRTGGATDHRSVPTDTARALDRLRVAEAMHAGVVSCPSETPLAEVAKLMADAHIHCVVVTGEDEALWGVVSDLDVAESATGDLSARTAGGAAATPLVTVAPDETLTRAAQLMVEHNTSHLVVVDPVAGRPVGVFSTLDLARTIGRHG